MEYGYVQDEDGEMVQLSDGLYSLLIQSQDRNVRKNAFDVMYASYGQFENSLASTLSGEVKPTILMLKYINIIQLERLL